MPEQEFGSDGQVHDEPADFDIRPGYVYPGWKPEAVDTFEASEPGTAAQRLRAFEDKHLGPDAVRIHGDRVERGSGSLFQRLSVEKQKAHAAIEKTTLTEKKLADAHAALLQAESDHEAAMVAAEDASRLGSG